MNSDSPRPPRQANTFHTPSWQVVYEDADFIAVNKPAGLLCVPGLSEPANLYDQVKIPYPHARVVHRLDMATSGLMLFALHYEAQKRLNAQFAERAIKKRYRARVTGIVTASWGDICAPLLADWPRRPRQKIDWRQGKPALTGFKVLTRQPQRHMTELALFPVSGRSHQLRLHMQLLGHPIVGDRLYGRTTKDAKTTENDTASQEPDRMYLHAEALQFTHPLQARPLSLYCPADFS